MQIIYDKENAVREKMRIDAETPEKNRKAKVTNHILAILTIAMACAYVFGSGVGMWFISTLDYAAWQVIIGIIALIATIFIGVGLYTFYGDHLEVIMPAEDYYTPAIQYHCAKENKKILSVKALGNPPWKITIILEDEEHIVTEKEIHLHFAHKVRTDISETIINLDERVVYTPFNDAP